MGIAIYTRGSDYISEEEIKSWLNIAVENIVDIWINKRYAEELSKMGIVEGYKIYFSEKDLPTDTELILSYGGDGTMLGSAGMLKGRGIPIMGINSGRLGFLANVPRMSVLEIYEYIKNKNYIIDSRSVLEAEGRGYALNEFSIQKIGLNMINIKLTIDGEDVVSYDADGLLVATPTGSTAYSMSVGGPIVAPNTDCLLIQPIAPHNLTMRPLVVSANSVLEVSAFSRCNKIIATLDNDVFNIHNGEKFILRRRKDLVKIAQLPDSSFYSTIRKKLMWGLEGR
ncbi:MAG: NAD(+)/NADH kinase [Bacteroidetes bacterium]|nr:NAD(+)/NADH kinase [Bacteroidota bacterium]